MNYSIIFDGDSKVTFSQNGAENGGAVFSEKYSDMLRFSDDLQR